MLLIAIKGGVTVEFIVQDALKSAEKQGNSVDVNVGQATIKVIGSGGAGNNMADWLYKKGVEGAEIITVNTDVQHLNARESDKKILIGRDLTRGLGCGGKPELGMDSAREQMHEIKDCLRNTDMVFVCAGLGGGTGTGAAPIIAQAAKEVNSIVIGVVTMPFTIEKARIDKAEWGLKQLRQVCDTVIVIDNNRLSRIAGNLPIQQAFAVANEIVSTMIKGSGSQLTRRTVFVNSSVTYANYSGRQGRGRRLSSIVRYGDSVHSRTPRRIFGR